MLKKQTRTEKGGAAIMKTLFDIKTIKFIIVGLINTLVGTAIMFLLYNIFSCSYWVSSSTNYIVTSILSYVLNKHFTFNDQSQVSKSLWKFIINIGICYFVAYGIAKPFTLFILAGYSSKVVENAALFIGMIFFTGLNYFGQRFFVFSERKSK